MDMVSWAALRQVNRRRPMHNPDNVAMTEHAWTLFHSALDQLHALRLHWAQQKWGHGTHVQVTACILVSQQSAASSLMRGLEDDATKKLCRMARVDFETIGAHTPDQAGYIFEQFATLSLGTTAAIFFASLEEDTLVFLAARRRRSTESHAICGV